MYVTTNCLTVLLFRLINLRTIIIYDTKIHPEYITDVATIVYIIYERTALIAEPREFCSSHCSCRVIFNLKSKGVVRSMSQSAHVCVCNYFF